MAKDAKTVAETVDLPEGLDVIPTVPGTFVGGHDVQGADGKPRDDRPGEILGTPAGEATQHDQSAREQTLAQTDFVTAEVDRTNREVLPLLGGPDAGVLGWEPDEGGVPEFIANARTISPKRAAKSEARSDSKATESKATETRSTGVTTANVAGTSAARPQAPLAHPAKATDK